MSYLPGSQTISNINGRVGIKTLTPSTDLEINGTLQSVNAQFGTLSCTTGTISNLNISNAVIPILTSTTGTITNLSSTNASISTLTSTTGTITNLTSTTGTITNLFTSNLHSVASNLTIRAPNITIGESGDKVTILGDTTFINTTITEISDPTFVINKNNTLIAGSGIIVSQTGFDGETTGAYALVNETSNGWIMKAGDGPTINLNQDIGESSSPQFQNATILGNMSASTGIFNIGLNSANIETNDIYLHDELLPNTGAHLSSYGNLVYAESSTSARNGIIIDTTNAYKNVMVGNEAIFLNVSSGVGNTSIGIGGLTYLTSGSNNISIGMDGLRNITTSNDNISLGSSALYNLIDGDHNIAIGLSSSVQNIHGSNNVSIGYLSQQNALEGANTSVGTLTLNNLSAGQFNSAFGSNSLQTILGSNNVGIGALSGQLVGTGSNNIFIGYSAGNGTTDVDKNIIISGDGAATTRTGDEYLQIGNAVYGNNIYTAGSSQIGINKSNPSGSLDVSGTIIADSFTGTNGHINNLTIGANYCSRKWYSYSSAFSSTTGPLQLTFTFANDSFVANTTAILNKTDAVNDNMSVAEYKAIGGTQNGSNPINTIFVSNYSVLNSPETPAVSWTGAYPVSTLTTNVLSALESDSNLIYYLNVEVIKGTLVSISDNDSPVNNTITFNY